LSTHVLGLETTAGGIEEPAQTPALRPWAPTDIKASAMLARSSNPGPSVHGSILANVGKSRLSVAVRVAERRLVRPTCIRIT